MAEVEESIHIEETPAEELKRWKSALGTDNLAHILLERQGAISLIRDFLKETKNENLKNRAQEFLKGIK